MRHSGHDDPSEQGLLPGADLAAELGRARQETVDEREKLVRTLADFKNYRRRVERDGNTIAREGTRAIVLPLLEVMDDLEHAMQWTGREEDTVAGGLRMIHAKLHALLESAGVSTFECSGHPFDPARHEAVATVDDRAYDPETVVDVVRRGYLWNDSLLRPAQVRVAR